MANKTTIPADVLAAARAIVAYATGGGAPEPEAKAPTKAKAKAKAPTKAKAKAPTKAKAKAPTKATREVAATPEVWVNPNDPDNMDEGAILTKMDGTWRPWSPKVYAGLDSLVANHGWTQEDATEYAEALFGDEPATRPLTRKARRALANA